MSERIVEVAVPLPVQTTFTYRVPELLPAPCRGARVLVPFSGRRVIGVVTGSGRKDVRALKDVCDVLDETPLAPPPLFDLAEWVSAHYVAPPGECHRLALPPAGVRASRAMARLVGQPAVHDPVTEALRRGPLRVSTLAHRLGRDPGAALARLRGAGVVTVEQDLSVPGFREVKVAVLSQAPLKLRGKAQGEVVERLRAAGGALKVADLVRGRPSLRGALQRLAVLGVVRLRDERAWREPEALDGGASSARTPSPDQARALGPLLAAVQNGGFQAFLLHGVTGSGKTEVYLRAAEHTLAEGRGVLILVPEIALTPLLVREARRRFGAGVSVLHSELSAGERHDQWWRIRGGESMVVIGARSAVFAPLPQPGLIVVDEEHEAAYKQEDSPRYHARDVAVMRARLEGAVALLGSATPSLESHQNALNGKYTRLALPARVGPHGLARVAVVDRREALRAGGDPVLTPPLHDALAACLERREQSLLLLNRRGYATRLVCRECGESAPCPNCSVALVLHHGGRRAQCHYCGHQAAAPPACASCGGAYLRLTGYGTEKVAEVVKAAFPGARVDRLDRDVLGRRGAVARVLAAFAAGETDVLVGTQMIAKGHDFPRVTVVGVVDADVGLGLPDFRAAERTLQLLTQVAGRAGRAEFPGEVILQTHLPDHYALRLAWAQDYETFFEREMLFRRTMGYPPTTALVNVVFRGATAGDAYDRADEIARRLRSVAGGRFRLLGPAAAPLARLRGEHRVQILLKGNRSGMRTALRRALVERYGEVRWPGVSVDVDPASVM